MATKKKTKKPTTSRKGSRVGGAAGDGVKLIISTIVGMAVGEYAGNQFMSTMSATTKGLIFLGVGGLGVVKVKNPILRGLSLGVAADGGTQLLRGFGVLNGVGESKLFLPVNNNRRMLNGIGDGITASVSGMGEGLTEKVSGGSSRADWFAMMP